MKADGFKFSSQDQNNVEDHTQLCHIKPSQKPGVTALAFPAHFYHA